MILRAKFHELDKKVAVLESDVDKFIYDHNSHSGSGRCSSFNFHRFIHLHLLAKQDQCGPQSNPRNPTSIRRFFKTFPLANQMDDAQSDPRLPEE